jgi:hypothetical protein
MSIKTDKFIGFIPVTLLLFALLPMPYAYYQVMRWLIAGFAAFIAWEIYQKPNLYQQRRNTALATMKRRADNITNIHCQNLMGMPCRHPIP